MAQAYCHPGETMRVAERLSDAFGDRAWVLLEGDATRRLGAALAWAAKAGAVGVHVLVDDPHAWDGARHRAGLVGARVVDDQDVVGRPCL